MSIYIVNNSKLVVIDKDIIALKEVLLNNIIIISNLINTLHISKLLINLLLINTLTKQKINVNFYNNKSCIIVFDDKQILYAIKYYK